MFQQGGTPAATTSGREVGFPDTPSCSNPTRVSSTRQLPSTQSCMRGGMGWGGGKRPESKKSHTPSPNASQRPPVPHTWVRGFGRRGRGQCVGASLRAQSHGPCLFSRSPTLKAQACAKWMQESGTRERKRRPAVGEGLNSSSGYIWIPQRSDGD